MRFRICECRVADRQDRKALLLAHVAAAGLARRRLYCRCRQLTDIREVEVVCHFLVWFNPGMRQGSRVLDTLARNRLPFGLRPARDGFHVGMLLGLL